MSSSATINSLVTRVRTRGDVVGSSTFDDSVELKPWIRESLRQLHEMLIQRYNDFYVSTAAYSLMAGQDCYALPANFRRLQDVFVYSANGASRQRISSFNSEDYGSASAGSASAPLQYRLMRNSLYIMPTPIADLHNALLLLYTPSPRNPVLDYVAVDDTMPEGWEEWVVLDVLQKMNVKARILNMDDILKTKTMTEERLMRGSYNRDAEAPMMRNVFRRPFCASGIPMASGPAIWVDA